MDPILGSAFGDPSSTVQIVKPLAILKGCIANELTLKITNLADVLEENSGGGFDNAVFRIATLDASRNGDLAKRFGRAHRVQRA